MPEAEPPRLIEGLLRPSVYDHAVGTIGLVETHISWVILTGRYAYKIKKPVDFGFADFSTPERREFCCHEELRLNRRLAPDLYLAVVPVTGTPEEPRMDGPGPPIDHAVKMRQFAADGMLDRCARQGSLQPEQIDRLAELLAVFHAGAPHASPESRWGRGELIRDAMSSSFDDLLRLADDVEEQDRLELLRGWSDHEHQRLADTFEARRRAGFVRECHGDLHLGNLVLIDGRPTPFDCLEFNPALRWIDLVSEIAFLTMDLAVSGNPNLAFRFLNRYEEILGDYAGLGLLRYYQVYRALVRAKVIKLALAQHPNAAGGTALLHDCRRYLDFALRTFEQTSGAARTAHATGRPDAAHRKDRPMLVIMHGLSGSGKSHVAGLSAEHLPAIRLRSDVERKRLAGATGGEGPASGIDQGRYNPDTTRATYRRLAELASTLLDAGLSVIVDAAFLLRWQRDALRTVAHDCGTAFRIIDLEAPPALLRQRIRQRENAGTDPSEATIAVLDHQIATREPLTDDERADSVSVDAGNDLDPLAALLGAPLRSDEPLRSTRAGLSLDPPTHSRRDPPWRR